MNYTVYVEEFHTSSSFGFDELLVIQWSDYSAVYASLLISTKATKEQIPFSKKIIFCNLSTKLLYGVCTVLSKYICHTLIKDTVCVGTYVLLHVDMHTSV